MLNASTINMVLFYVIIPTLFIIAMFWYDLKYNDLNKFNSELNSKNKSEIKSEIKTEKFVDIAADSELSKYGISESKNPNNTFVNFHFHAAPNGFLIIGDFILIWGSSNSKKRAYFPLDLLRPPAGAVAIPYNRGGGKTNLRIDKIDVQSVKTYNKACERPFLYLAYGPYHGFGPGGFSNNFRGVRITANEDDVHDRVQRSRTDEWNNKERFMHLYDTTHGIRRTDPIPYPPKCSGSSGPCCIM